MNSEKINKAIEAARKRFEVDLKSKEYSQILSSDNQLKNIMSVSKPSDGKSYLDIGTGAGYIAFELAKRFPDSRIVGIDIADSIIEANNKKAEELGLTNLHFKTFPGKEFPFKEELFDGVFSRYCFHHFPIPSLSISEISRVLKSKGFFFITDPTPYDEDDRNFSNEFSELRNDGHIKYYTVTEICELLETNGFNLESIFYDEISFPRIMDERYVELFSRTPGKIKAAYKLKHDGKELNLTLKVMNILFRKEK